MKKRERYVSIVIVPHHKGTQKELEFSYTALRWLGVLGAVLLLAAALLVVNYGHIFWRAGQYELMKKRQAEMETQFGKLSELNAEISRLKALENKLNVILGVSRQPDPLNLEQITAQVPVNSDTAAAGQPQAVLPASSRRTTVPAIMPCKGWISAGMTPGHTGVDIAAREGDPVWAAADGEVSFAGWDNYFGHKIEIKHSDKLSTMYGHNAKLLVKVGDKVKQGKVIALVGSTGQSSGPHLHFEVRLNGQAVDPINYLVNK
ncbi:M23 family metallopeptidase [candidate division TA06 bacterium]|uniref:M23 family metallopeptidase n=1 Tax=candidate division TA06 bacterium TaxID=2250710 RepID=A0A933IB50_UNCT6|nr:M23 family metallopeptidase [candidate division TA06 bacterium]